MGSLPQFEEYGDPLLRGHLSAVKGIGGIGLLKGIEDADYFLHNLILPWLFYFGILGGLGMTYSFDYTGRRLRSARSV